MVIRDRFYRARLARIVAPRTSVQPQPLAPFESWKDTPDNQRRIFRPLLFAFQHMILPRVFFNRHPELERALSAGRRKGYDFLHFWSQSVALCQRGELWSYDQNGCTEYLRSLYRHVAAEQFDHDGMRIWLVSMPPPLTGGAGEAFLVAMCRRLDKGAGPPIAPAPDRYFTLESVWRNDSVSLCEWTQDSEHRDYGAICSNNPESFLASALRLALGNRHEPVRPLRLLARDGTRQPCP